MMMMIESAMMKVPHHKTRSYYGFTFFVFLTLLNYCQGDVTALNTGNFSNITSGKAVFVKFFAPWCGHCQAMAPAWQELANEYKGNESILIAEVDCTESESTELCTKEGANGFPTIKYGDPDELQNYEGDRDYASLMNFAAELKPPCLPNRLTFCNEVQVAAIEKYLSMSKEDLDFAIMAANSKLEEIEQDYSNEQSRLKKLVDEAHDKSILKQIEIADEQLMGVIRGFVAKKLAEESEGEESDGEEGEGDESEDEETEDGEDPVEEEEEEEYSEGSEDPEGVEEEEEEEE